MTPPSASMHGAREARGRHQGHSEGADRGGAQSFQAVSEQWFKRYVEAKGLRSASEIRRYLDKHILPAWGGRDFTSIRRSDVADLLDEIEDDAGPVAADYALSRRSASSATGTPRGTIRIDTRGKGNAAVELRTSVRATACSNDDELRAVWKAAEANGTFGAFVRMLC